MTKFKAEFLTKTDNWILRNTEEVTAENADEAEKLLAEKYNIQPDSLTMWIVE